LPVAKAPTAAAETPTSRVSVQAIFAIALLLVGIWSYWPTLVALVETWSREPDYSHGFLVIPVAIYCVWLRRATFPGWDANSPLIAVALLLVAIAMRVAGARFFLTFMDGWSILPWVAAVVTAAGGRRLLWWCLPSIGLLFFMIPLPYSIGNELSYPLQRIATKLSVAGLQVLGQPAFADGNVILLRNDRFEVAEACSGLRLFFSILALTYGYIAIIQRPWWEKVGLCVVAIPVAIVANASRIVATAILYQLTTSESIRQFAHDSAGWGTILLAGVLLAGCLYYFRWLIQEEEELDLAGLVRETDAGALALKN
jgi:exosortase